MKHTLAGLATILAAASAFAQTQVSDAWIRATVPHQTATGAFMQLTTQRDSRLVGARSPAAAVVEIHEMSMDNNVMRMRPVDGLDLPAGKAVELKPGGYHIMLTGLKAQVKEGERVPLTLLIEGKGGERQKVELQVPVKALQNAMGGPHGKH